MGLSRGSYVLDSWKQTADKISVGLVSLIIHVLLQTSFNTSLRIGVLGSHKKSTKFGQGVSQYFGYLAIYNFSASDHPLCSQLVSTLIAG